MLTNRSRRFSTQWSILIAVVLIVGLFLVWKGLAAKTPSTSQSVVASYSVSRGDLVVDAVVEGTIDAAESQVIRSKVEGRTTLISIVPEGTTINDKDVEDRKILVQLDSSLLREKRTQQEIMVQSARAALSEASASYLIQVKINESALKAGELKAKFGLMDLEKYLGANLAHEFLVRDASFGELIRSASLGGEALQKRRELDNTKFIEQITEALAKNKFEWTTRLNQKGFVSTNDLKVDELAVEKSKVAIDKADTAIDLFKQYEFQKQAEKLRSDYEEALRDLDRIVAKNRSELAKAEAKLASASATFQSQNDILKKILDQIENCTVRATQPGLVVYAGSDQPYRNDRQISEGAEVFERQEIIKIPNTVTMIAKAKVHESVIARIREGQPATVRVEAMPDKEPLTGVVKRVAILPDSQNRWMSPDIKVYQTDVTIERLSPDLKPGMTVQVRIIINQVPNVLMVPVQAVQNQGEDSYCLVAAAGGSEKRKVEVGEYNDNFLEIRSGLKEGDQVALIGPASDHGSGEDSGMPERRSRKEEAGEGQGAKDSSGIDEKPSEGERPSRDGGGRRQRPPQGEPDGRPRAEKPGREVGDSAPKPGGEESLAGRASG